MPATSVESEVGSSLFRTRSGGNARGSATQKLSRDSCWTIDLHKTVRPQPRSLRRVGQDGILQADWQSALTHTGRSSHLKQDDEQ